MIQDSLFCAYSDYNSLPKPSPSTFVYECDGAKFSTLKKLFIELNHSFQFGGTFGNNLDALFDSMTDLSWLKEHQFVLIFKNSDEFLKDESEGTIFDFLNTLNDISGSINDEPMFSENNRSMRFYFEQGERIEQLMDDAYLIWEAV